MCTTCPAHLILLALITPIILDEEYKPCSSSLCSFLQPPFTSSLSGESIYSLILKSKFTKTTELNNIPHCDINAWGPDMVNCRNNPHFGHTEASQKGG
jgi:hypothetical protein